MKLYTVWFRNDRTNNTWGVFEANSSKQEAARLARISRKVGNNTLILDNSVTYPSKTARSK